MEVQQFMPAVLELSKKVKQAINAKQKTGFKTDTKFHNNLVTEVDVMAEKMLVEGLSEIFPEAGFIAEEGTGEKAEAWNWIIDPIDGTTNFSRGIPVFSISIALHHPELGVQLGMIHDLGQDHQYWAVAGKDGAFKDEESISCTTTPKLANSLLATGFPYDNFSVQTMYINLLNNLFGKCLGIRRMGSAAIDLAYVAEGKFDLFFEYGLNPWDVAAGYFIVEKAGGKVSGFNNDPHSIFSAETLVSNGYVHQEFQEKIEQAKGL